MLSPSFCRFSFLVYGRRYCAPSEAALDVRVPFNPRPSSLSLLYLFILLVPFSRASEACAGILLDAGIDLSLSEAAKRERTRIPDSRGFLVFPPRPPLGRPTKETAQEKTIKDASGKRNTEKYTGDTFLTGFTLHKEERGGRGQREAVHHQEVGSAGSLGISDTFKSSHKTTLRSSRVHLADPRIFLLGYLSTVEKERPY